MKDIIEKFNDNNYEFILNDSTVVCYHYYGKNREFTIKICCNIKEATEILLKKAVLEIKKTIKNKKKYIAPIHGCTDYLETITLKNLK